MPELPEVESLRRYLIAQGVPGRVIVSVEAGWRNTIKAPEGSGFLSGIVGRQVRDVRRRGKYLLLPLSDVSSPSPPAGEGGGGVLSSSKGEGGSEPARSARPPSSRPSPVKGEDSAAILSQSKGARPGEELPSSHLILHMGMTGSLAVMQPDDERQRFAHTVFYLDDDRRIELNDPRKWASVWLVDDPEEVVGGLGPEPFDPAFTDRVFADRVRVRRSAIKTVLMDQSVVAGVGNIYADEALLHAGVSPVRQANRISQARLRRLHNSIRAVLAHATGYIVEHPIEGDRPYVVDAHDERMEIERRRGALCPACGSELRTRSFGGRTSYYCRICQK